MPRKNHFGYIRSQLTHFSEACMHPASFTRRIILAVVFAVGLATQARAADDAAAAEQAAITKTAEAFVAAFEKGDAPALAAFWTPDGDYIDSHGRAIKGREAIAADFAQMFKDVKGLKLRIEVTSVRLPTPDTAIEDGVTSVIMPDNSPPVRARYTNTLVKQDGKWLLASVRESHYTPPNNAEYLRPLEWLIGDWMQDTKEAHAARVLIEWTPDRNFIIASREVGVGNILLDNGHQRIGWDPASKQLRSWTFESDGGFAEGAWMPDGEKWTNRVSAVLRNGSLMTSTTVVTRVDADTLTWQSKEQVMDGKALPDSPIVTMKRAK